MKLLKTLVGVVGVAIVVVGVVLAGDSSLAEPAVEALGNDYLVVAVPAVLAVALVVLGLVFRAASGISQATPPDPEGVPTVPTLGSEFDEFVTGAPGLRSHLLGGASSEMHERLREAAIRTEMRVEGITREAATDRVDAGEWTADRHAATYCRPDGASGPFGGRLRAATRGRTWSQYGAARTADALVERSDAAAGRAAMNGSVTGRRSGAEKRNGAGEYGGADDDGDAGSDDAGNDRPKGRGRDTETGRRTGNRRGGESRGVAE